MEWACSCICLFLLFLPTQITTGKLCTLTIFECPYVPFFLGQRGREKGEGRLGEGVRVCECVFVFFLSFYIVLTYWSWVIGSWVIGRSTGWLVRLFFGCFLTHGVVQSGAEFSFTSHSSPPYFSFTNSSRCKGGVSERRRVCVFVVFKTYLFHSSEHSVSRLSRFEGSRVNSLFSSKRTRTPKHTVLWGSNGSVASLEEINVQSVCMCVDSFYRSTIVFFSILAVQSVFTEFSFSVLQSEFAWLLSSMDGREFFFQLWLRSQCLRWLISSIDGRDFFFQLWFRSQSLLWLLAFIDR